MGAALSKDEYEGLVLAWLRQHLAEELVWLRIEGRQIRVEDVRLNASDSAHMLEILLREEARPGCLFGWRFPATEADSDKLQGEPYAWEEGLRGPEQAEVWAGTFAITNLEEQIMAVGYGFPTECDPEGVTWFGDYLP